MLFLTLSKADIQFAEQEFIQKTYITGEALPTTKSVEIINKKKSAVTALNASNKIFMVHVAALAEPTTILIHPSHQAQVVLLTSEKTGIPVEYSDFSNDFSLNSMAQLSEYTRINDHPINLLDNKQLPYSPIYSLRPVELEMFKNYIKANLASSFIRSFKCLTSASILFIQKKDGTLCLCIDY